MTPVGLSRKINTQLSSKPNLESSQVTLSSVVSQRCPFQQTSSVTSAPCHTLCSHFDVRKIRWATLWYKAKIRVQISTSSGKNISLLSSHPGCGNLSLFAAGPVLCWRPHSSFLSLYITNTVIVVGVICSSESLHFL